MADKYDPIRAFLAGEQYASLKTSMIALRSAVGFEDPTFVHLNGIIQIMGGLEQSVPAPQMPTPTPPEDNSGENGG